jgi:hypothetical protein
LFDLYPSFWTVMAATWRVGVGREPSIPHPATHAIVPKQSHLPYRWI